VKRKKQETTQSETVYMDLKDLAERLSITVFEKNLKQVGTRIESGLCIVKGKHLFIMDKHKAIREKIEILATHLAGFPHDDIYMMPALRKILEKYQPAKSRTHEMEKGS
jgi:hypothetical protein